MLYIIFNCSAGIKTMHGTPNIRSSKKSHPKKASSKQLVKVKKAKTVPVKTAHQGEILLVKMRGFCEWPGRVEQVNGNVFHIKFFGDGTICTTTSKNMFSFKDNHDIVLCNLRGRKKLTYAKAVKEAELSLGIPADMSIFNKI